MTAELSFFVQEVKIGVNPESVTIDKPFEQSFYYEK